MESGSVCLKCYTLCWAHPFPRHNNWLFGLCWKPSWWRTCCDRLVLLQPLLTGFFYYQEASCFFYANKQGVILEWCKPEVLPWVLSVPTFQQMVTAETWVALALQNLVDGYVLCGVLRDKHSPNQNRMCRKVSWKRVSAKFSREKDLNPWRNHTTLPTSCWWEEMKETSVIQRGKTNDPLFQTQRVKTGNQPSD